MANFYYAQRLMLVAGGINGKDNLPF